jgi:hypothetical protein
MANFNPKEGHTLPRAALLYTYVGKVEFALTRTPLFTNILIIEAVQVTDSRQHFPRGPHVEPALMQTSTYFKAVPTFKMLYGFTTHALTVTLLTPIKAPQPIFTELVYALRHYV